MELHKLNETIVLADIDIAELSDHLSDDEIEKFTSSQNDTANVGDDVMEILTKLTVVALDEVFTVYPELEQELPQIFCDIRFVPHLSKLIVLITSEALKPSEEPDFCENYITKTIVTLDGATVGLNLGEDYTLTTSEYQQGEHTLTKSENHNKLAADKSVTDIYQEYTKSDIVAEFKNIDELLKFSKETKTYDVFTTKLYTYGTKYYVVYNVSHQSILLHNFSSQTTKETNPLHREISYPLADALDTTESENIIKTYKNLLLVDLEESSVLSTEQTYLLHEFGTLILSSDVFTQLKKI